MSLGLLLGLSDTYIILLVIDRLQKDVALAPHTTYKIGGPADLFVNVNNIDELTEAVKYARQNGIPYFILGSGANILVSDKGFRGLVIHNCARKAAIVKNILRAESGATIADLIDLTAEKGLSGLEHFAGIPSTVGGAIWQNLHFLSPDRQTTVYIEGLIESVTLMDERNKVLKVDKSFLSFGYDYSVLHKRPLLVLEATFQLVPKDPKEIKKQIQSNLAWRNEKQPQLSEYASCGSVFKKIAGIGAGRLIDQAGLKGKRIGNVMVSSKHTNYLVNLGNAKASDVIKLIKHIQKVVKQKTGYFLEPEIGFIGEF